MKFNLIIAEEFRELKHMIRVFEGCSKVMVKDWQPGIPAGH
jgi:hypothetical protein